MLPEVNTYEAELREFFAAIRENRSACDRRAGAHDSADSGRGLRIEPEGQGDSDQVAPQ